MLKKRVFLAVPVDPVEPVVAKMEQLKRQFYDLRIKWVRPENFHLTVFFFGEIPAQQVPLLRELLRSALKNTSAFSFLLTGPGIFKKGKELKVLWLGIKGSDQLYELKKETDNAVATLGFLTEDKPFRPHLTLGRFLSHQSSSSDLENSLKEPHLWEPVEYEVTNLILFESKLFPDGPQYDPIEVFPLLP